MRRLNKFTVLALSAVAALTLMAIVNPANATWINVNMYNSAGTPVPEDPAVLVGPIGGSSETWNQYNTTSGSGLTNSAGVATSIGFTCSASSSWYRGTGASLTMFRSSMVNFGKGSDTTFKINSLTPGTKYDIWVASCEYNSYDPEAGHGEWSTPNTTVTVGIQPISNFDLNGSTWEYGNNFVCFEQVVADANGEIVLYGDATDAGEIDTGLAYRLGLSGWQIQESSLSVAGAVDPDVSAVTVSPTVVLSGGVSNSTVTVTLKDSTGLVVTNKAVILLNTAGPQAAVIAPSTAQTTDAAGMATFNVSSVNPGIEVFTASNVTDSIVLTQTVSVNFVGLVDADVSTVEAWPTNIFTDGSSTITVSLKDASGIPIPGKDILLLNTAGPQMAVIDPLTAQTSGADGVVTFTVTPGAVGMEVFSATNVTDSMVITQTVSVEIQELPEPLGDLFSVNLYAYGRGFPDEWLQESWKETVRIDTTDADRSAGVWETISWQNVTATDTSETITSDDGLSTATFSKVVARNAGPYNWSTFRDDSDSVDVGNATLLDGHGNGTSSAGDPFPTKLYHFAVTDIPFAMYEVIVYLGVNGAQYYDGVGRIRINEEIPVDPLDETGGWLYALPAGEPTGLLDEVESDGDGGNYVVFSGLTDPIFEAQVFGVGGNGFCHTGPAGFQIRNVPPPGGTMIMIK